MGNWKFLGKVVRSPTKGVVTCYWGQVWATFLGKVLRSATKWVVHLRLTPIRIFITMRVIQNEEPKVVIVDITSLSLAAFNHLLVIMLPVAIVMLALLR